MHEHTLDYLLVQLEGDKIAGIFEADTHGAYPPGTVEGDVAPGNVVLHERRAASRPRRTPGTKRVPRDPRRAQGVSGPAPAPDDRGPLAGLRVLEVATLFAAPQVGAMLGDLGADVVKVEPPTGDPMREMGHAEPGAPRPGSWSGGNKRSIVLDLDDPDGAGPRDVRRARRPRPTCSSRT